MEHFREQLKTETIITAILCVILAAFSVLGIAAEAGLVELMPVNSDEHWQSMWHGMISGASFGVLAVMVASLVRGVRALKNEKELKKVYVEANDERQQKIWTMARSSSMQTTLLVGLVAGLVIGYFNMTVGITILAVETIHAVTGGIFKLYYNHKF